MTSAPLVSNACKEAVAEERPPLSGHGGGQSLIPPRSLAKERVSDYPRPPRLEPAGSRVRVLFDGITVADSSRALRLLETFHPPSYYIPPGDVRLELFEPTARGSLCEWKGAARYFTLRVGSEAALDCAWAYPDPSRCYEALKNHLAFYVGRVEACYLDDERVVPQPGGFYCGWISSHLEGPFKGGPGTEGW